MGVPYSKEINQAFGQANLAFDQVTPLVAAGSKVLQATKYIIFLLGAIQVLTAIFLGLILITLLALIITVNPDLEYERQALVTPVVRWLAHLVMQCRRWVQVSVWAVIIGAGLGAAGGWYGTIMGVGLGAAGSWYVIKGVGKSVEIKMEGSKGGDKSRRRC